MWRWETLVALGDRKGAVGRRSGELSGLGRQKLEILWHPSAILGTSWGS